MYNNYNVCVGHAFVSITMCSLTLFMQVIFVLTYDLRNSIPYRSNLYRYVIVKVHAVLRFYVIYCVVNLGCE